MAILYGVGRPIITVNVGAGAAKQRVLLPIEPMSFKLAPSSNVVKSTKFNTEGQVVTAGTAKRGIEWTLTLGVEAITWAVIQMALNEVDQTSTGVTVADLKFATMPATGTTYEISDADVTVGSSVQVALYGDDKPKYLVSTAGTAGAGQFKVSAGKITLGDANLNGKVIGYRIDKTVATCKSIGVESANFQVLDNFTFEGILKTDSPSTLTKVRVPSLRSASDPTVDVQSVTRFELVYDLITDAGKKRPFDMYDIDIA